MIITEARIIQFSRWAKPDFVAAIVAHQADFDKANIDTPRRVQHFFSQMAVETWNLTKLEEVLSYSAKRLVEVFPNRFPDLKSAIPFEHNPRGLANKVYGGRYGNTGPDDGWIYRGGGGFNTTFRDNYRAAGYENNPDDIRKPDGAILSAIHYWTVHGCNAMADIDSVTALRKAIQGGERSLSEAKNYRIKAKRIFV